MKNKIWIITLLLNLVCSFQSFAAYNGLDLNIGRSVNFAYNRNMDQQRFNLSANGIIGLDKDNQLFAPAVRYNILPVNERAFLDNVFVNLAGYYATLEGEEFENSTVTAIGFGGGARLKLLDEYSFLEKPLYLAGGINYAPPGTTYRDGNNLLGWLTQIEYPIFGRSLAYVGFRSFTTDLQQDDGFKKENAKIDQTVYVGVHFVF